MRLASQLFYQTGGEAAKFFAPKSLAELSQKISDFHKSQTAFVAIGDGTNTLASDAPLKTPVLSLKNLDEIKPLSLTELWVGAGVRNSELAIYCLERNLAGAAWMFRLPGQIGATVRMNARCFGGEISQIVTAVQAVSPEGKIVEFPVLQNDPKAVFRGYKDTIFMGNGHVIANVKITLKSGTREEIWKKMQECEKSRLEAGHFAYPSCGCVFKNDYKLGVSSGLLLDLAGAKNHQIGAARVSDKHANFIYNTGLASSADILALSLWMRERVWEEFGAWLEYEMEFIGQFPEVPWKKVKEVRAPNLKTARLEEARQLFSKKLNQS